MGVPKFYRWLSERYPQINQTISNDTLLPEIDVFYLDMNGIIHACTHPNDSDTSQSLTMREMVLGIFRYIDRMVTEIVKPRKVLYMAIDGVAPRAKLNQQRARRFRSAEDRKLNLLKLKEKDENLDENLIFDSNSITPGTEFMEQVSKHIVWFIRKKIKDDLLWRNLTIIFNGHDVPGEGEHKIMEYIRQERIKPTYDPNTRHCMYGGDADLIMLGLATHEPHFVLLREVVNFNFKGNYSSNVRQTVLRQTKEVEFQLLYLSILREYIEVDLAYSIPKQLEKERLFDDFVFLTFLVGNDFLPHLPTLDISEHAFDVIFNAYKEIITNEDGYIVENGELKDLKKVELLFSKIGLQELDILEKRELDIKQFNSKRRKYNEVILSEEELEEIEFDKQLAYEIAIQEALGNITIDKDIKINNEIIGSKDYHGRYYYEKFDIILSNNLNSNDNNIYNDIISCYLHGLMWCLAYYCKGCISWTWYYPYHYGPMLQDMKNLSDISISFNLGEPFLPYNQLLGCLPPLSKNLLPKSYQWLMSNESSPIIQYYPQEFQIDQDGKKNPWEAIVLLPFIKENELKLAVKDYCNLSMLSNNELNRNQFGHILLFHYDPYNIENFLSYNRDIGLNDIIRCQSNCIEIKYSLFPSNCFQSIVLNGNISPIAGFPTIGVLKIENISLDFFKINIFGTDSKYRSMCLHIDHTISNLSDRSDQLKMLLGRSVYVNYPSVHEAKVVAVTTETEEYRIKDINNPINKNDVIISKYDSSTSRKWKDESENEQMLYKKGRRIPGTGGLVIGPITIRLRVLVLQGMKLDYKTGARKKVFGKIEADIPIQLALWEPICDDPRFVETDELPIHKLMPIDSEVIAISGKLKGFVGKIVGPHSNTSNKRIINDKRVVDVEFTIPFANDTSFGYSIALSISDDYLSSREVCKACGISASNLGKLVGSIFIEPGRYDIGLNLKRNGQYQLIGYIRKVESTDLTNNSNQWLSGDTVTVIGSLQNNNDDNNNDNNNPEERSYFEYSYKTIDLILQYKRQFPILFYNLNTLPHKKSYTINELLTNSKSTAKSEVTDQMLIDDVITWLKSQPFFKLPRTPLTTQALSLEAMKAIEEASDTYHQESIKQKSQTFLSKSISIETLFRNGTHLSTDAPLNFNNSINPKLGDRVINLTSLGVPFGLRGTVVVIHKSTGYVEVIFDSEFVGGKNLQGYCSDFRGRLCSWSGLLRISTDSDWLKINKPKFHNDSSNSINYSHSTITNVISKSIDKQDINNKSSAPAKKRVTQLLKKALSNDTSDTIEIDKPIELGRAPSDFGGFRILKKTNNDNIISKKSIIVNELPNQLKDMTISNGTGRSALAQAAGNITIDIRTSNTSDYSIPNVIAPSYVGYIPNDNVYTNERTSYYSNNRNYSNTYQNTNKEKESNAKIDSSLNKKSNLIPTKILTSNVKNRNSSYSYNL